ncbi:hypothetical protein GALL_362860 [mine drainage metagenome]|uniref:Uncharacterized protein n=1 Tax=mine drainage metagenome TaxID=410659 RepID=A0A1J5QPX6_9ZZZZ
MTDNIDSLISQYANGQISSSALQEATGLSFNDILERLAALNIKLPRVDTYPRYNDKQKLIYDKFFGIDRDTKNE